MRWLPVLVVMVSGCAARGPRDAEPISAEGLCWWQNVKWDDRAPLLMRGSDELIGRARVRWTETTWRGARVMGVLRNAPRNTVVFEGEWRGDGLVLGADVNATEHAIFQTWDPTKLSTSALLLRGAPVRLLDARVGAAIVAPSVKALAGFVPVELPVRELNCDSLALRASLLASSKDERALLVKAGFPHDVPELALTGDPAVKVSDLPTGGDFIGGFFPRDGNAYELARQGDAVRVGVFEDTTLWVGWVAASNVSAAKATATSGTTLTPTPAKKPLANPTWHACAEDFPLTVRSHGHERIIGTLEKDTRFSLTGERSLERAGLVGIIPGVDWLELARDVELLIPEAASACKQVVGPW